jgi:hypothetical protein
LWRGINFDEDHPMPTFAVFALAAVQAAAVQPAPVAPPATPTIAVAPAAAAPATTVQPAAEPVLRTGAAVPLVMAESITTAGKTLRVGQRVRLAVASDVQLGAAVAIPAGSPAEGEVTAVRNKGMWGKSGRIEARVLNVRVGDRLIRLNGKFDDKGKAGTLGVLAATSLLPFAGFFVTGTSASIPAGSGVEAVLAEDLPVAGR